MNSEKNILLKNWEKLSDETIIKEVSTKGRYINLCISFLSKRNSINVEEAKIYFSKKVYQYIQSLLINRQIFKAEHVVKNIDESPKYVFYQIIAQLNDDELKSYIFDYLRKSNENFDIELKSIELNWTLLNLIKSNKTIVQKIFDNYQNIDNEIINNLDNINLNNFLTKYSINLRSELSVLMFFETNAVQIINLLDKEFVWSYFLKINNIFFIKKWIDFLINDSTMLIIDENNEFKTLLYNKFIEWEINNKMLDELNNYSNINSNEIILNLLAKLGFYSDIEKKDLFKLINRIYSTENINKNKHLLLEENNLKNLLNYLIENKYYNIVIELLSNYIDENIDMNTINSNDTKIIKFIINVLNSRTNYNEISKLSTEYLPDTKSNIIKYFENVITELPKLSSSHYNIFKENFDKHFETMSSNLLEEFITKNSKFNIKEFQLNYSDDSKEMIHFGNKKLQQEYSESSKLSYFHYIKQNRSSYAIYLYIIEQLQHNSKITKEKLNHTMINITELAFNNYTNKELIIHCVSFIEMLGYETIGIRSQLKLFNFISKYNKNSKTAQTVTNLEFLNLFEEAFEQYLNKTNNNYNNFYPLLESILIYCNANKLAYPEHFLKKLLNDSKWFIFIILTQLLNYPLKQIITILKTNSFNTNLSNNLINALSLPLSSIQKSNRLNTTGTQRQSFSQYKRSKHEFTYDLNSNNSQNTTESSSTLDSISKKSYNLNEIDDLYIVLLEPSNFVKETTSSSSSSKYCDILTKGIERKWPLLVILAEMEMKELSEEDLIVMWKFWLQFSVDYTNKDEVSEEDDVLKLITFCVINGFIRTLHTSMDIFFPIHAFIAFTKFLLQTIEYDFSEATSTLLQDFIFSQRNNNSQSDTTFLNNFNETELKKLLIEHLINNFHSNYHKKLLIKLYCDSEVCLSIDFCCLKKIYDIIEIIDNDIIINNINLNNFYYNINIFDEYKNLLANLMKYNEYDIALKLSDFLDYDKELIVLENWKFKFEQNSNQIKDYKEYENYIERYSLNHELLVDFYIKIFDKITNLNEKYSLLKRTLEIIKKYELYPNEKFDRDRIEYDMVQCYIQLMLTESNDNPSIEIYHSNYYETYLLNNNKVIRETFLELKEIAEIEDLSIFDKKLTNEKEIDVLENLILRLIDDGDIVEALRIQAMFDQIPNDLHFIAFSMALAENITSLYNLTNKERQILSCGLNEKSKYNRYYRPLSISLSSSPNSQKNANIDTSDNTTLEFEEIPPREKQDILEALQGLSNRLKHGIDISHRIIMIYRAAMYLDKQYVDILKITNIYAFLNSVRNEDCFNKLIIINDILLSMKMNPNEIAEFLSDQISTAIIKSRFYTFNNNDKFGKNYLWGYNLDTDFRLFLDLCPNTTILGNYLLKYCDCLKIYRKLGDQSKEEEIILDDESNTITAKLKNIMENQILSQKKQNIISVELLIKSHECFVNECFMEGIANVLQKAKILNNILSQAKSWSLIVRLLIGIGRYREMYYCFETLIKNEQFESLLGQFEEHYTNGLKHAIISFLHENYPENIEYYRLAALHFCMYQELGQLCEIEAKTIIAKLLSQSEIVKDHEMENQHEVLKIPYLKFSNFLVQQLNMAMEKYAHSAENFLLDNKLNLAQKSASNAELIALQINLIRIKYEQVEDSASQILANSVLNIRMEGVYRYFVNYELSIHQALILSRSYTTFKINWADAIYIQYVTLDRQGYLHDYLSKMDLTENVVENIVKLYQTETKITRKMEQSIVNLIKMVESISLKYKLASLLGLKQIIAELINAPGSHYLKDTEYGRHEEK